MVFGAFITTETRRTQRMHLDNLKPGHYSAISQDKRPNLINESGEA